MILMCSLVLVLCSSVSDCMIVSINFDQKPNGEWWWRERCSKSACEQNNRCRGQTKVRLRSDTTTASKRQQERAAQQLVQHNCWRKAEGNTLKPAVFSATGWKKSVHLSGGLGAARPPSEQPFTNQACLGPAGLLIPTQAFGKSAACVARRYGLLHSARHARSHARSAPLRAQLLPSTCWDV